MTTDDAIRVALAEALAGHRPSISGRAVCTCGRGQDFGAHLAAESLPAVRRLMQQQAAEELREAAEAAEGMHNPVAPDCAEWADWLRARADRLAPEPAP